MHTKSKHFRTVAAFALTCALAVGLFAFAPGIFANTALAASEPIGLSYISPEAFPAQGVVNANNTAVRIAANKSSNSLGKLQKGDELHVLDYIPGTNAFYQIAWEDGVAFIQAEKADVTFAQKFTANAAKDAFAFTQKSSAKKYRAFFITKDENVNVLAREGKWWLVEQNGETAYAPAGNIAVAVFVQNYLAAGVYGNESVQVIKGNVLISAADVTLQNMVIQGNLCIAKSVNGGNVTLIDAYVSGATLLQGDVTITNKMDKVVSAVGSPSAIMSDLFRENYANPNEQKLEKNVSELAQKINEAVFSNGKGE